VGGLRNLFNDDAGPCVRQRKPRGFQIAHLMLTRCDQPAETWRNLGPLGGGADIPGIWNEGRTRWNDVCDVPGIELLGGIGMNVRHDSNIGELSLVMKP
jgi:hypothetical protein